MVKIISNVKGDMVSASVELAGDLQVIVPEIGSAISSIYNQIKAQDKSAANAFRFLLTELVSNEKSPMWDTCKDSDTVCTATLVRKGAKLTGDDIADLLRRGTPIHIVKALLEEMDA